MFFSDIAALQRVTAKQHNPLETRYGGDHAGDPEIERMLNGSPLIQGWEPTLQTEELYTGDDQVRCKANPPLLTAILIVCEI